MRNMLLVAKREYLEQIRGRAFRISTILVPALIVFLLGVSGYTGRKLATSRHIAIAADNPSLAADIRDNLLSNKSAHFTVEPSPPSHAQDRADLQARLENKSIDGCSSSKTPPPPRLRSPTNLNPPPTSSIPRASATPSTPASSISASHSRDYPSSKSTRSSNLFRLKNSRFPRAAKPARARAWRPFTRPC